MVPANPSRTSPLCLHPRARRGPEPLRLPHAPRLPGPLHRTHRRHAAPRPGSRAARITRGLLAGACVSAGFVAVFGVLGLLLEGGARLATGWLPWVMAAVGVVMAGAGISTLLGRAPALHLSAPRFRTRRSVLAMAGYGVAYAAGSLSCSLPLFLAAVAGSFTGQGSPGRTGHLSCLRPGNGPVRDGRRRGHHDPRCGRRAPCPDRGTMAACRLGNHLGRSQAPIWPTTGYGSCWTRQANRP